jgi:hypothetical protein
MKHESPVRSPSRSFQIPLVDGASNSTAPTAPTAPPSSKDDFSARDLALYTILGVLFGSFLTGGFPLYDSHPVIGSVLVLVGAVGLVVMAGLVIWYRLKIIHALIVTIAALVGTWGVFAYMLWTKPKEVIVHDPPTAEDIQKATAPMGADRDAEKQRADNAQSQQAAAKKTVDDLTNELNSTRAQLGRGPPFLDWMMPEGGKW